MSELTATALATVFAPVPGHPHLSSDTPVIAGMLMEQPWADFAGFMRPRVDVRLTERARGALAIEPDAVHDPPVFTPPVLGWAGLSPVLRRDIDLRARGL